MALTVRVSVCEETHKRRHDAYKAKSLRAYVMEGPQSTESLTSNAEPHWTEQTLLFDFDHEDMIRVGYHDPTVIAWDSVDRVLAGYHGSYEEMVTALQSPRLWQYETDYLYQYQRRGFYIIAQKVAEMFPFQFYGWSVLYALYYTLFQAIAQGYGAITTRFVPKINSLGDLGYGPSSIEKLKNNYVEAIYRLITSIQIRFQTEDYRNIVKWTRGLEPFPSYVDFLQSRIIARMFRYCPRSYRRTLLFRGFPIRDQQLFMRVDNWLRLGIMSQPEYCSSSRTLNTAMMFANKRYMDQAAPYRVIMIYDIPAGFPMMVKPTQFEQEILIPPCTGWIVKLMGTYTMVDPDGFQSQFYFIRCSNPVLNNWGHAGDEDASTHMSSLVADMGMHTLMLAERIVDRNVKRNSNNQVISGSVREEKIRERFEDNMLQGLNNPVNACQVASNNMLIREDWAPPLPDLSWRSSRTNLTRPSQISLHAYMRGIPLREMDPEDKQDFMSFSSNHELSGLIVDPSRITPPYEFFPNLALNVPPPITQQAVMPQADETVQSLLNLLAPINSNSPPNAQVVNEVWNQLMANLVP